MRGVKITARANKVLSCPIFKPHFTSVQRPDDDQLHLWGYWDNQMRSSQIGLFYELVTLGFYGGKLSDSLNGIPLSGIGNDCLVIRPDIVDDASRIYWESKGSDSLSTFLIKLGQMDRYAESQLLAPNWRTHFAIYRHRLHRSSSFVGSEGEIYSALSKNTSFSLVLPLSVILELAKTPIVASDGSFLTSHYGGSPNTAASTRVSSKLVNLLFDNPEGALTAIGLNPSDYNINTVRSSPNFHIDHTAVGRGGKKATSSYFVDPFPVTLIHDRNHSSWFQGFAQKMTADEGSSDLVDEAA